KPFEEFRFFGAAPDRQEIYDLDEEPRLPAACPPDGLDQFAQAWNIPVVPYPQERPAGDISDASRFDHNRAGPPFGKTPVPVQIILRHEAVFGRAPGDHRRNPRPAFEFDWADFDGLKKERAGGFFTARPARLGDGMSNRVVRAPHMMINASSVAGKWRNNELTG